MCGSCRRPLRPRDAGEVFAHHVERALADMKKSGIRPAALLVDTIFSSDGVFADPPGFLRPAVEAVRAEGALFIADEVQPGFGRCGGAMWGFARHGLVPDLVTMGKPMGNGHPVAGMAARPELLAEFGRRSRYFNTFGGNPVSAAAGIAVLDVIESEGLMQNAQRTGGYLVKLLGQLQARHPLIAEIRGAGLFVGVELRHGGPTGAPATAEAARVVNLLRERRVLISSAGPHGNVLKIRPPLVFGTEHADLLVETLDQALAEVNVMSEEVKGCARLTRRRPAGWRRRWPRSGPAGVRSGRARCSDNERTCRISTSSICAGGTKAHREDGLTRLTSRYPQKIAMRASSGGRSAVDLLPLSTCRRMKSSPRILAHSPVMPLSTASACALT